MGNLVRGCHNAITNFLTASARPDARSPEMFAIFEAMQTVFRVNSLAAEPLPVTLFYSTLIADRVDPVAELMQPKRSFRMFPFLLSLDMKAQFCQCESTALMEYMATEAIREGMREAILEHREGVVVKPWLILRIRRSHLVEDAISELSNKPTWHYMKELKVVFDGEEGKDAGGLSREFFYLVSDRLLSPRFGMFKIVEGRFLWFSRILFNEVHNFYLCGAIVSLAVHNAMILPVKFPLVLYKKLLTPDKPLTLADLEEVDSQAADSLRQIEAMKLQNDDVAGLGLTFSATVEDFGEREVVPLVPAGQDIAVTNENCEDYIHRYINLMLFLSIKPAFDEFARGFQLATQAHSYKLLDPSELDLLVSGEEKLDWSRLPEVTSYDGYTANSPAIRWFWEIFAEMSETEKRQFLKFSCGTDRAPFGGVANMRLVIQKLKASDHLPISHTCFNIFSLPEYPDKATMELKIKTAIQFTEGFGME
jgi:hypothetical protein